MGYKIPAGEQKRYGKSLSGSRKDTENPSLGAKKNENEREFPSAGGF